MITFADFLTYSLATLTVAGQLIVLVLIVLVILKKRESKFVQFFTRNGIVFSLVVVALSIAGSLSYSDILMHEPCKLCWYQRIFMYPQFVILALGLAIKDIAKDSKAAFYALILAILGAPVAFFHYLLQRGVVDAGCSVVGNYSVSCASYFKMSFGYITIPMMAFTAFLMIITFLVLYRTQKEA